MKKEIQRRGWMLEVSIEQKKRNGGVKKGIQITSKEYNFSIFWRMEEGFEKNPIHAFQLGANMDALVADILKTYSEGIKDVDEMVYRLQCFEFVKDAILPVLYPETTYEQFEKECPNESFFDLKVCYYLFGEKLGIPVGNMLITKDMVRGWHITEEVLKEQAMENQKRYTTLINLEEVMGNVIEESPSSKEESHVAKVDLYVLRYDMSHLGAAALLNREKLTEFANELQTKRLVIIPSSIDECLILDGTNADIEKLRSVIFLENIQIEEEGIVLSFTPYYYDVEEGYGSYDEV